MAYTPENNPYIPGDPYSYDLKWIVAQIKYLQGLGSVADAKAAAAMAEHFAKIAEEAAGSMTDVNYFTTPELFGAKADGVTDDTAAIQAALESDAPCVIFKSNATYKVSKGAQDLINYPGNDQPCVYLANASHKYINGNGATLKSDVHAQGVFEVINSSYVIIDNLNFTGYSSFVPVQNNGRGEKGNASDGYYNIGCMWGYNKNNSLDTSNFTGINGSAVTWGTFGGGFIGNVAAGLMIHQNCSHVVITNCSSSGFNYAGFAVGFLGDTAGYNSKDVSFYNCYANNMYDCGFDVLMVDDCIIKNCNIENVGQPECRLNNTSTPMPYTVADPGYGITCRKVPSAATGSVATNVLISGNDVRNCVRKGIDIHAGQQITVSENSIYLCWVGGINVAASATIANIVHAVKIINNTVRYCGNGKAAIEYFIPSSDASLDISRTNVLISGNTLEFCSTSVYGFIYARYGEQITISDNIIRGVWPLMSTTPPIINAGNDDLTIKELLITGNSIFIDQQVSNFIRTNNIEHGTIANNIGYSSAQVDRVYSTYGGTSNGESYVNNTLIAASYSNTPQSTNTGAIFNNIYSGRQFPSIITGTLTETPDSGKVVLTHSAIKTTSIILVQTVYTSYTSVDNVLTVQKFNGYANIFIRNGGSPGTEDITIDYVIINLH